MWNKIVEKVIDTKIKVSLQPSFGTRKIDFKCPKRYKLSIKKAKNNTYWKQHNQTFNKNKEKAKSHNPSSSTN